MLFFEAAGIRALNTICTVGYEGTDIDRFVATLKTVGVNIIVDVRAVAQSRKKGFSKKGLQERLFSEGINYIHFIELGDPKDGRLAARAGNYDEFRKIYNEHVAKAEPQLAIEQLKKLALEYRICLLCFERDPKTCHRSIVANQLEGGNCQIWDLYADDPKRYVRNAARLPSSDHYKGAA